MKPTLIAALIFMNSFSSFAQAIVPMKLGPNSVLSWDASTDPPPASLPVLYEIATREVNDTSALNYKYRTLPDELSISMSKIENGLVNGETYNAYVRAIDAAGNRSDWADPIEFKWDNVSPSVPVNITINININIDL
jgi:hypothetical protein